MDFFQNYLKNVVYTTNYTVCVILYTGKSEESRFKFTEKNDSLDDVN